MDDPIKQRSKRIVRKMRRLAPEKFEEELRDLVSQHSKEHLAYTKERELMQEVSRILVKLPASHGELISEAFLIISEIKNLSSKKWSYFYQFLQLEKSISKKYFSDALNMIKETEKWSDYWLKQDRRGASKQLRGSIITMIHHIDSNVTEARTVEREFMEGKKDINKWFGINLRQQRKCRKLVRKISNTGRLKDLSDAAMLFLDHLESEEKLFEGIGRRLKKMVGFIHSQETMEKSIYNQIKEIKKRLAV